MTQKIGPREQALRDMRASQSFGKRLIEATKEGRRHRARRG